MRIVHMAVMQVGHVVMGMRGLVVPVWMRVRPGGFATMLMVVVTVVVQMSVLMHHGFMQVGMLMILA